VGLHGVDEQDVRALQQREVRRLAELVAQRLELGARGGADVEVAQRRQAHLEHAPPRAVALGDRVLADEALREQRGEHAVRRGAGDAEVLGGGRDAHGAAFGDDGEQAQRAADGFDRVGGLLGADAATVPGPAGVLPAPGRRHWSGLRWRAAVPGLGRRRRGAHAGGTGGYESVTMLFRPGPSPTAEPPH
jgi:hypothetical protein